MVRVEGGGATAGSSYRFFGPHALNGPASWAPVDPPFLVVYTDELFEVYIKLYQRMVRRHIEIIIPTNSCLF
jgi:hypothetical protein